MSNVLLGLSGGARSAAALRALVEQGAHVIAITIDCPFADVDKARAIAETADVEFCVIDGTSAFDADVVRPWATLASRGAEACARALFTTNVLFALLEREAQARGCTHIATGHRAKLAPVEAPEGAPAEAFGTLEPNAPRLDKQCRVIDSGTPAPGALASVGVYAAEGAGASDQSWLLGGMAPTALEHLLLPVGATEIPTPRQKERQAFPPEDVRALLHALGLPDYPGDIVDKAGNVLGRYESLCDYRLGQSFYTGAAAGAEMRVVAKDPARRRLVLAPQQQTLTKECLINDINWLAYPSQGPVRVWAKAAPGQFPEAPAFEATVETMGGIAMLCGSVGGITRFMPDAPTPLILPGQTVAFYNACGRLLGAGTFA